MNRNKLSPKTFGKYVQPHMPRDIATKPKNFKSGKRRESVEPQIAPAIGNIPR